MLVSHSPRVKLSTAAILVASIFNVGAVHAAGYQVAFDSVGGLGRAYAGEAAVADSAAVVGRNPAAMTLFKKAEFSGALIVFDADVNVTKSSGEKFSDDTVPSQAIPASYYVQPINEKWAFGIGMYSNYGLGTDLTDNYAAGDIGGETAILSVNLNPAVAYRINPMLSVGAGIDLIYATAEMSRHLPTGADLIGWDGDDFAVGWNVGALLELDENNRFGLSYRAGVNLELSGDFNDSIGALTNNSGSISTATSKIPLPAIIEFSGFNQLNEKLAIHYSALWSQWSDYTEFKATSSACTNGGSVCFNKSEEYDDSWRWAIGATYQLNPIIKLRAGVALDQKAGTTTLSVPDQDAFWYATGLNYQHSSNWSFDVALAYMHRSEETFSEKSSLGTGTQEYTTDGYLLIFGMQANYRF